MTTIAEILHGAMDVLGKAGSPTPRLDAEVLLADCLKTDRLHFYTHADQVLNAGSLADFEEKMARRKKGEPVSYIVGFKEFWSLPFRVTPAVLVPRPETEVLVEEALAVLPSKPEADRHVLEIGTGSGAVAIALAVERKDIRITATDLSPEALALAQDNAERNGVKDRIRFLPGDLFVPVAGQYDLIVSNPPYISQSDFNLLPPGIRDYEPVTALLAGPGGTEVHRKLIAGGVPFLKSGGWLLMEMGDDQGAEIRSYLHRHGGYEEIGIRRDYGGAERVIKARRK